MNDLVVVMARAPVPGAVKTRLAGAIGDQAAAAVYRAFLRDLHRALVSGPWRLVWAVLPAGSDLAPEVAAPLECFDQRGPDLGARMANAFADLFAGGAERVVMLGADAPHLAAAGAERAMAALSSHDVALLPSRDGGYALVGLRRELDLFSGIEMSTALVLQQTLARARDLGATVDLLPESFDVDDVTDLRHLALAIASGEVDLPFTRAALEQIDLDTPSPPRP